METRLLLTFSGLLRQYANLSRKGWRGFRIGYAQQSDLLSLTNDYLFMFFVIPYLSATFYRLLNFKKVHNLPLRQQYFVQPYEQNQVTEPGL